MPRTRPIKGAGGGGNKLNDLSPAIFLSSEVAVIKIGVPLGKLTLSVRELPQLVSLHRQQQQHR